HSSVPINAVTNNQRPALALSQGVVYVSWSSFCDTNPFNGWIAGFNATTLAKVGAFNTTPTGSMAGIWMGAAAPVIDPAGSVYVSTGNGTFDGTTNFGESVLKLTPSSLARQSFFTPSNWATLNSVDNDLGSSGPIILPGLNSIVSGSKEGKIYLMNTANLGGTGDGAIPQVFQAVDTTVVNSTHHIHNSPVAWQSPAGLNLYIWGENDFLRAYRFNTGTQKFNTPAFAVGSALPPLGMPGGMMAISANGSSAGSAIVWATTPKTGDANHMVVPGILRAFNAETLALLWDSNSSADDTMSFSKFNPPVVANGKVYVASFSNRVSVYGPRMAPPSTPFSGTPINLPGTIEAENFDNGGEGVAYHDADTGNTGGAYRMTDVDLQTASEGNVNVGWIVAGEWLKYTVNVATAGTYDLSCRVASQPGGGSLRVEVDGVDATGTIAVGATGGWANWATVTKTGVNLPAGRHVLRVFFPAAGMNLNSLTFASGGGGGGGGGSTPFTGTPVSLPGTIEAENFDNGGEGVAYHDTDAGNTGGADRTTDVDIQTASEGAFNVGWIAVNEWLKYSVNVTAGRAYTLNARIASQAGGGAFRVEVDGVDVTGSIAVQSTGSWTTWANVTKTGVNLPAGNHVLRVFFTGAGMNLNSLTFQ
ncbi:MAG: hypothetical protein QOI66_3887, partial [Myxococcales bacterium]|nr:hypothetical protein [Myxococcales bacterium]